MTCWSASTCCAKGSTFPNAGWCASSMPTRKASCARETSLIQTIGRAARNVDGRVILYADRITGSMERAMAETDRRREKQRRIQRGTRHHARPRSSAASPTSSPTPPAAGQRHRRHRRRRAQQPRRPQSARLHRRPRKADARRRRRSGVRGSRPPARRNPPAGSGRTWPARRRAKRAPIVGRSNEGKPGTRKMRYGKTQRKWKKWPRKPLFAANRVKKPAPQIAFCRRCPHDAWHDQELSFRTRLPRLPSPRSALATADPAQDGAGLTPRPRRPSLPPTTAQCRIQRLDRHLRRASASPIRATIADTMLQGRGWQGRSGDRHHVLCRRPGRHLAPGVLHVQWRPRLGLGVAADGRVRAKAGRDPVRRAR